MDLNNQDLLCEESLITYPEFMQALKNTRARVRPSDVSGTGESLFKTLLPRTLSFAEVLHSKPVEDEYTVCDT